MSGVRRTVEILDAFRGRSGSLSLKDIADVTGIPMSTSHRIVSELTAVGVLDRGDDRRYTVGLRLFEIGSRAPRAVSAWTATGLRAIVSTTGETAFFGIPDGGDLVVTDLLASHESAPTIAVGDRLSLATSAPGLVAHAFGSRRSYETTPVDPRIVEAVRRNLVAVAPADGENALVVVSSPVFRRRQILQGVVSLVTTSYRPELRGVLAAASRRMSEALQDMRMGFRRAG